MKKIVLAILILLVSFLFFSKSEKSPTAGRISKADPILNATSSSEINSSEVAASIPEKTQPLRDDQQAAIFDRFEYERIAKDLSDTQIDFRLQELEQTLEEQNLIFKANHGTIETFESNTLVEIIREQSALQNVRIQRRIEKLKGKI